MLLGYATDEPCNLICKREAVFERVRKSKRGQSFSTLGGPKAVCYDVENATKKERFDKITHPVVSLLRGPTSSTITSHGM